MRTLSLAALMVAYSLAPSAGAPGQATAEAALAHALSSTAGSAVGTALGKATNQLSGKLGQQVSSTAPRRTNSKAVNVRVPASVTPPANSSAPTGPLIVSIQGGEPSENSCAPVANANPQAAPSKDTNPPVTDAKNASTVPSKPGCQASQRAETYQSVITLPPAQ